MLWRANQAAMRTAPSVDALHSSSHPKANIPCALGLFASLEQVFKCLKNGDHLQLAVKAAPSPDKSLFDISCKGGVAPCIICGTDHIKMGGEQRWFNICILPSNVYEVVGPRSVSIIRCSLHRLYVWAICCCKAAKGSTRFLGILTGDVLHLIALQRACSREHRAQFAREGTRYGTLRCMSVLTISMSRKR